MSTGHGLGEPHLKHATRTVLLTPSKAIKTAHIVAPNTTPSEA